MKKTDQIPPLISLFLQQNTKAKPTQNFELLANKLRDHVVFKNSYMNFCVNIQKADINQEFYGE